VPGGHYAASPLADFLNGERRQVWALHRDTGEPFFLAEGEAERYQEFAKAHLRCPYSGCTARISTRGGSKRDGFFHIGTTPHAAGRESEFHVGAKAMLAQWARARMPEGAAVREEHTVKDPATSLHRRADVMVTGRSGRQVAYEVEYKTYKVDDWRKKQADYDNQDIPCLWLIGHTRVRLAPGPVGLVGLGETAVKVPLLAAEMAAAGKHVVVVNPSTREVGTLSGDSAFSRHYRGGDTTAWLALDALADCRFDHKRGLLTPTMLRIDEAEEKARLERQRFEAQRPSAIAAGRDDSEAAQERLRGRESAEEAAWKASALHALFVARWGAIPGEFTVDLDVGRAILAAPTHWHAVLHEELLQDRTADFRWRDVFAALDRHGIQRGHDQRAVFAALASWLGHVAGLGMLKIHRDSKRKILLFSPTGVSLEQSREARVAAEDARRKQALEARIAKESQRLGYRSANDLQPGESVSERSRTKLVILPDGRRRFEPK
jgi:hypothetical protein